MTTFSPSDTPEWQNHDVPLLTRLTNWISHPERMQGVWVTEAELSLVFGVSRTPLREVLNQLNGIGLIRRQRSRSIEIPPLSVADMVQLSRTREELEALITVQVTERHIAREIDIGSLERINRQMGALAALGDTGVVLATGRDFHGELRLLSGNHVASFLLEQLMLRMERYRQCILSLQGRSTEIVHEHDQMLEAIRAGDTSAAAHAARAHIVHARAFYRDELIKHGLL
ncbi:GntR family transcriptional regulator [Pseudoxanthomonas sp. z9]|uniref:GntR family transcriptional regulator n=1 Tax=Pseudoxanthomonas sp. z9 TaxID=2584942 RepID=UPI001141C6CE|nr:GntR family transcriptional regulator [Pseudoxanthomonas sp. z9]